MNWLGPAMSKCFGRCAVALGLLALPLSAQVRGVPASVTSYGFGGHFNPAPGPPASVTSLGPNGYHSGNANSGRGFCCGTAPGGQHHRGSGFGNQRRGGAFFGGYTAYYSVPYPVYIEPQAEAPAPADQFPEEEYRGGPTIFDRRGPGPGRMDDYAARAPEPAHEANPEPPTPAAEQPQTLLIFKDGHQIEVQNYAIVGDTLVDLTEGHRRKVPLADLDVEATAKQNDDRGIDFRLPPTTQAN